MLWTLVTLASLLLVTYLTSVKDKNPDKKKVKSGNYWVIATTVFKFLFQVKSEDRLNAFKQIHKFFPRYTRIKIFNYDNIIIYDPELCKKVFNAQVACQRPFRNCIQLECGLLSSEYHYWKASRKHLNLAFHLNVLKGFIPIFNDYAGRVVKEMEEKNLDGKEFDLMLPLAQLTVRTVAATMMNVHGVETSSYQKLIDSVALFLDILLKRMIMPFLKYDFIFKLTKDYKLDQESRKFTMDYGDELIEAARKRRIMEDKSIDENGNEIEKKDMKVNYIIDQLVNHEEKFTNQEIREHLMVLLITASETSANYVASTLVYLAIYQDVQQKVYDEIMEVFGDENVEIDYDSLNKLKYLEMVMKETLRLFSPIPISIRETIDELDIGVGKPLSKGANIFIFNYVLHRRRDIWGDDADKFDPERFSQENVSKRDPYSFLPFGAGPRMCIGKVFAMLSAKIELMRFIKAYKFNTTLKEKEIKMKLAFTGKMSEKHRVSIERRNLI